MMLGHVSNARVVFLKGTVGALQQVFTRQSFLQSWLGAGDQVG